MKTMLFQLCEKLWRFSIIVSYNTYENLRSVVVNVQNYDNRVSEFEIQSDMLHFWTNNLRKGTNSLPCPQI